MKDRGRLLSTEEVAAICRTKPGTVRYWRFAEKGPPGFKLGRRVMYWEADLYRWLDEVAANDKGPRPQP